MPFDSSDRGVLGVPRPLFGPVVTDRILDDSDKEEELRQTICQHMVAIRDSLQDENPDAVVTHTSRLRRTIRDHSEFISESDINVEAIPLDQTDQYIHRDGGAVEQLITQYNYALTEICDTRDYDRTNVQTKHQIEYQTDDPYPDGFTEDDIHSETQLVVRSLDEFPPESREQVMGAIGLAQEIGIAQNVGIVKPEPLDDAIAGYRHGMILVDPTVSPDDIDTSRAPWFGDKPISDAVLHEFVHAAHHSRIQQHADGDDHRQLLESYRNHDFDPAMEQMIRSEISENAAHSPMELVAETGVMLAKGKEVSDSIMSLYRTYLGPEMQS